MPKFVPTLLTLPYRLPGSPLTPFNSSWVADIYFLCIQLGVKQTQLNYFVGLQESMCAVVLEENYSILVPDTTRTLFVGHIVLIPVTSRTLGGSYFWSYGIITIGPAVVIRSLQAPLELSSLELASPPFHFSPPWKLPTRFKCHDGTSTPREGQ